MAGYKKSYNLWLYGYIVANIVGAIVMYRTGFLVGDVEMFELYSVSALWIALLMVIATYFIILKPVYHLFSRIKVRQYINLETSEHASKVVGILILLLQVGFLAFNLIEGVNIAGATQRSQSPISVLWIFVPIDTIFLIYYVQYRETRLFWPNITVFLVSNILRGWSGVFLLIIFLEWCRMYRRKKINFTALALMALAGILIYPYLLYVKYAFRTIGMTSDGFDTFWYLFSETMKSKSYMEFLEEGVTHVIGRIQYTSIIIELMHYRDHFTQLYSQGKILPFWQEGLPQLTYRQLLGIQAPNNLGVELTYYFSPHKSVELLGSWNINPGYVAWILVAPTLIPFYILYTLGLALLSVMAMKQFKQNEASMDVIWLAWLVYLIPGWMNAFVTFIYCMVVMMGIVYVAKKIAVIRTRKSIKTVVE